MKTKRLLKLVDLLRADARNKKGAQFDLTVWAGPSTSFTKTFDVIPETVPVDCGTSACAMGLAVISGEFKNAGLKATYFERSTGWMMEPVIEDKYGDKQEGFDAACVLFGITDTQARYLFSPDCYPENKRKGAEGERYVAARIKKLVKKGDLPRSAFYNNNPRYALRGY